MHESSSYYSHYFFGRTFRKLLRFLPETTVAATEFLASYIPEITGDAVRFGIWIASTTTITGLCFRAGGRLTQEYIQSLLPQA